MSVVDCTRIEEPINVMSLGAQRITVAPVTRVFLEMNWCAPFGFLGLFGLF